MSTRAVAVYCGALLALAVPRAEADCGPSSGRPRLGLVLSGGGARGIAHVGALKALEQRGIRPDCIAGTSMGAFIGALYASGYNAARIEQIVRSLDWQRIYSGRPERALVPLADRMEESRPLVRVAFDFWRLRLPRSAEPDFQLRRLLAALLTSPALMAGRDFDRLPFPFRAVAADLESGERIVLGDGSLEAAVRASVSTPITLEAVRLGGRLLVDGGVVDNMPVDVARQMGAEVVIAVDTRSPPLRPEAEDDALDVAAQLADVLIRHRNLDFAREADLTVQPDLQEMDNTDYAEYERAMAEGYRATLAQAAAIRALAPEALHGGDAAPQPVVAAAPAADGQLGEQPSPMGPALPTPRQVVAVRVEGEVSVRESLVIEAFGLRPGEAFDLPRALHGLDAVWATRLFRSVWLDVLPQGEGVEVVVLVREADQRIIELQARFDEADKADVSLRLRHRNLFGRGESLELRGQASEAISALEARLSMASLFGSAWGFFVRAHASEDRPRRFREDERLGRADFDRRGVAAGLQTHLGPSALLRAGFERGKVSTSLQPGIDLPAAQESMAFLSGLAVWDTLDDRWRPTRGGMASLSYERSLPGLGASHSYWRLLGSSRFAVSQGRAALALEGLGFISGGSLPVHEQIRLGGPAFVPGLERQQLWGAQAVAAALTPSVSLTRDLRLLLRAGAGGVWDSRRAISLHDMQRGLGVGVEYATPVGPASIEWGHTGGESRVYVAIGYQ